MNSLLQSLVSYYGFRLSLDDSYGKIYCREDVYVSFTTEDRFRLMWVAIGNVDQIIFRGVKDEHTCKVQLLLIFGY